MPSKREALTVTVIMALFLLVTSIFIGLRSEHLLMAVLHFSFIFLPDYLLVAGCGPATFRHFLNFVVTGCVFAPNYEVNPIDVAGLYHLEKSLFGVMDNGLLVTPCEYFAAHNWPIADVLPESSTFVGFPFLSCSVFACISRRKEKPTFVLRWYFWFVNLIGFAGYYIHPAAPAWYAINYGFEPILNTPGNVAGLGRFDAFFGVTIFDSIYGRNANVFAAVPSLHAAYMVVALVYAIIGKNAGGMWLPSSPLSWSAFGEQLFIHAIIISLMYYLASLAR